MNKIPKHLWKDVLLLTSKHGQRVYLLGTSHVSQKSCEITKELISHLKPAVVFIEICKERMPMILDMVENDKNQEKHIDFHDTSIVESGSDLKTAFVTGLQFNSRIVLGDRLGRVTLQRVYHGHSLWQLYRATMKYSFESGFELKSFFVEGTKKPFENIDFKNLIKDWSTDFPWIVECVVNEREKYMVLKLQELLDADRTIQDVVVVCGAAHVMGLERQWGVEYTASEREEILRFLTTCPKPFEDDGCTRCTPKYIRNLADICRAAAKQKLQKGGQDVQLSEQKGNIKKDKRPKDKLLEFYTD